MGVVQPTATSANKEITIPLKIPFTVPSQELSYP